MATLWDGTRGERSGSAAPERRHSPQALALLSHELRTPLNGMIGYADAWRVEAFGPLPEPYRKQARLIHAAALHLLAVIEAMVDFPITPPAGVVGERRLALQDLRARDLEQLLADSVALLEPRAGAANQHLRIETAGAGPAGIRADPVALTQILINLLDNALKFGAPGGTITIGFHSDGDAVQLTVWNAIGDGPPGGGPGSRLGLRLAGALSEAMGGSVELEVTPGVEARATVRLPAIAAD